MNWDTGMFLLRQMKTLQIETIRQAARAFGAEEPEVSYTPEQVVTWLHDYADGFEKEAAANG